MKRPSIASALLLAMIAAAVPVAHASLPESIKPARSVSPAIQPMQRTLQKSGAALAVKPPLPPRRPGPVLELGATTGADGELQLHCDQHEAPPLPESVGDRP